MISGSGASGLGVEGLQVRVEGLKFRVGFKGLGFRGLEAQGLGLTR